MKEDMPIIIVTGGSQGLGQGIIKHLLANNFRVATFSRSQSEFIKQTGMNYSEDQFLWEAIDANDQVKVDAFINKVYKQFGRIDGLVNNAGVAVDGVLTMMQDADIEKIMQLNLMSVIKISRSCIKKMLIKKKGSIINISSIIGIRGYSGLSVYSATKAGLDGFTRAMARELGDRAIRVNSIAPGYLDTEMSSKLAISQREQIIRRTPLGRLGTVEDVAGVVQFLLSKDAQFITGQTLAVDGGITC